MSASPFATRKVISVEVLDGDVMDLEVIDKAFSGEKHALAKEHQGVYGIAREDGRERPDALRGLWVESGFPSENATTQN
jgi:hypothetical protein